MNCVNGGSHDINSERGEEGVSLMFTGGSGGPGKLSVQIIL